jgi:hypothetical protein
MKIGILGECYRVGLCQHRVYSILWICVMKKEWGGHVSEFFYFRISRKYARKCFQCRVITRNYEVSKLMRKLVITMSQ